ncbi:PfkB family carbohydrate kinase [Sphingobium ummariense]
MTTVVGGVYAERCVEPHWVEVYGSAGRAAAAISGLVPDTRLVTYRAAPLSEGFLNIESVYGLAVDGPETPFAVNFQYTHSLAIPRIVPRPDAIPQHSPLVVEDDIVLRFGMLEGTARIKAKRAVYDPQSAFDPRPFGENGSSAEELVLILNRLEARCLTEQDDPIKAAEILIARQDTDAVIVKMGGHGAMVAWEDRHEFVPAYRSESVFKIGSGDVYSAAFTYFWAVAGKSYVEAADLASKSTSRYCETMSLPIGSEADLTAHSFNPVVPGRGRIYLAAPFFNLAERWLVEEIREQFLGMGVSVFSPFHDVGPGSAEHVAPLDLKGLDECDAVLAVLNGGDAGTIFEVGYAVAQGKPVVALAQNMRPEDMKMPIGSNCLITTDLVSAIYHTIWSLT